MALLHCSHQEQHGTKRCFVRASAILHCVVSNSKHNYDALSLLVRLYSLLGSAALATQCYSQLSIKNVQHATLSWMLAPRLSTLHPHRYSRSSSNQIGATDPAAKLEKALNWHSTAENINRETIVQLLEDGQHNMALDAVELAQSLASGTSKIITWCELRRIRRLRNATWDETYTDSLGS